MKNGADSRKILEKYGRTEIDSYAKTFFVRDFFQSESNEQFDHFGELAATFCNILTLKIADSSQEPRAVRQFELPLWDLRVIGSCRIPTTVRVNEP